MRRGSRLNYGRPPPPPKRFLTHQMLMGTFLPVRIGLCLTFHHLLLGDFDMSMLGLPTLCLASLSALLVLDFRLLLQLVMPLGTQSNMVTRSCIYVSPSLHLLTKAFNPTIPDSGRIWPPLSSFNHRFFHLDLPLTLSQQLTRNKSFLRL